MRSHAPARWLFLALLSLSLLDCAALAEVSRNRKAGASPTRHKAKLARGSGNSRALENPPPSSCKPCEANLKRVSLGRRSQALRVKARKPAAPLPCHPKDYVDPRVAGNYKRAVREMKRSGITPRVTSAWRSSTDQNELHKCSLNSRCRHRRGIYSANPSGQSLHEAGLAVDIAGVTAGSRGQRRLTPRGRRIVRIMEKNGFKWRYGMSDPVHFEASPRTAGYRSVAQAIRRSQSTCQVKLAAQKKKSNRLRAGTARPRVAVLTKSRNRDKRPAIVTRIRTRQADTRAVPTARNVSTRKQPRPARSRPTASAGFSQTDLLT